MTGEIGPQEDATGIPSVQVSSSITVEEELLVQPICPSMTLASHGINRFPHSHRQWQYPVFRGRLLSLVSGPGAAPAPASSGN